MAAQHFSPALPASAEGPRAARPGYGKRSAPPGQDAPRPADFTGLPERERYVAAYIDRLPDGAAMDIKSLAKSLPLYGQMAIGSALRALAVAGHLRRVRRRVDGEGTCRWVTYTYWSRTARDNEWWTAALSGPTDVPPQRTAPEPPAPPKPPGAPSAAYLALAGLGRREPRLALSATDCATLEPLAAAWLARGASTEHLTAALTAGLPEAVTHPLGLVRRRLTDKMPPHLPDAPGPANGLRVECVDCGRPGPAAALLDGLCGPCRGSHAQTAAPDRAGGVAARVAGLRGLMRTP
ncbi:MarR family transcriptional regulator [Streptomyces drozdowiczii]|uniref:MarR family transcriptional regulator n=1 Tax=Streptomyces drozdowiczii TaxID=202862 RepID=A0ABY6PQJ0_9ACTN|nr:MarR family transcriptional regulator [Streptomyces drozdowiczii]MCX0246059.1 MarR family transcriptional regulator [Streptomyces drozdowiczii]UZK54386.1 MarR family transcriptional regulator [Streptomyces drozdowiczii]